MTEINQKTFSVIFEIFKNFKNLIISRHFPTITYKYPHLFKSLKFGKLDKLNGSLPKVALLPRVARGKMMEKSMDELRSKSSYYNYYRSS